MEYNGIEIDMLSLGDADCILVTHWNNNFPTHILIDGGYVKDVPTIEKFLSERGVTEIDYLVSTHLHDDHIRGLVKLVQNGKFEIGSAWMHLPERHVNMTTMKKALEKTATLKESRLITASVQAEQNLVQALKERDIDIFEPFQGEEIGPFLVCGPSEDFYQKLLSQYEEVKKIQLLQETLNEQKSLRKAGKLLNDPKTQAENLSCTILGTVFNKRTHVLTADAGVASLKHAASYAKIASTYWMQIPHHGSMYNINQALIDHLNPRIGFVSAEGNDDHPHSEVVTAFKSAGSTIYSTQNNGHLWHYEGEVPPRDNYGPAVPL